MAGLTFATPGSLKLEDLERSLGVFFIGYMFAMVLYGFTFFQSYMYYSRYPKDHWSTKTTVALLCLLDTAVTVLLSQTLYFYMVDLFPYTLSVEIATRPYCVQLMLSVISVFIAQIYYTAAVWATTKNWIVSGVTGMLSTAALVLGIVMSIRLFEDNHFSHLAQNPNKVIMATTYGMVAASGLLAFFSLSTSRLPAPYKTLEGPFDVLVSYVFSRGGAACIIQLALVFVFVGTPARIYWFPFQATAVKLFVVSAITMLNSREGEEVHLGNQEHLGSSVAATHTIGGSTIAGSGTTSGLEFSHDKHTPIVIEVDRSVRRNIDKVNYDVDGTRIYGDRKAYAR